MNNNKMPNKDSHSLHKKIGNRFQDNDFPNCKIVKSSECGGGQKIPLFCSNISDFDEEKLTEIFDLIQEV